MNWIEIIDDICVVMSIAEQDYQFIALGSV